jgi:hypothetical protein
VRHNPASHPAKGTNMLNVNAPRLACALVIAMAVITCAHAADSSSNTSTKPLLAASAAAPAYTPPYQRTFQMEKSARVVDTPFVAMSVAVMGLTIADIESTQHCLSNHTCTELNPMLPLSRAGMYAVNIPINAGAMYLAYRLKGSGHRSWWIAPAAVAAGHGVGFMFKF